MHKRIWEIAEIFYCPIVGTCLSLKEQRQFLRRCGVNAKGAQDYAVHITLIDLLKKESVPAKRFERLLNRKYRKEIAEWQDFPPEEWLSFFARHLQPDTAGALLWFSVIYQDLSERQHVDIYGRIHILAHGQFLQQAALLNQLARSKDQQGRFQEKYHVLQMRHRQDRRAFRELEQQHHFQQKKIDELQRENLRLTKSLRHEEWRTERESLQQKLQRTEERLHTRTLAVDELKAERDHLKQQIDDHQLFIEEMQEELAKMLDQFKQAASQADQCPNYALCNRRILLVGGITKLRAFYEQLVTRMGGQFEYHDGYKYTGTDALSHLVDRSDVVICPVDVNSHSACLHVKKYCKEQNKPYYMLRSSSLSAIHTTLAEVARIVEGKALA